MKSREKEKNGDIQVITSGVSDKNLSKSLPKDEVIERAKKVTSKAWPVLKMLANWRTKSLGKAKDRIVPSPSKDSPYR